jgi:RNA polymerase sigma-70 factor, ECF subfamily
MTLGMIDKTPAVSAPGAGIAPSPDGTLTPADLPSLVEGYADFVWRSVRRLGVPEAYADDATQQVFLVTQQKITRIERGRERAFLFSVATHVAAHARRSFARRRETGEEPSEALADPSPLPDAALDARRARAVLDYVLDALPMELRVVLVLAELEEMTMAEIAEMLALPPGTVASRLRRAREAFQEAARRVRAKMDRPSVREQIMARLGSSPLLACSEVTR